MPKLDWKNLGEVVKYAKALGAGMLVVKHEGRPNYNITHASRHDLWDKPSVKVMFRT